MIRPVVCIGGANLDILGRPEQKMIARDSNPGRIRFSVGGVARNIAENLARLDIPTELICGLGTVAEAELIRTRCRDAGIGTGHIISAGPGVTSAYLALSDEEGDMAWAVSDMSAANAVTPASLRERRDLLRSAMLLIVDTNIPSGSLAALPEICPGIPLYLDPVSTTKAAKISGMLSGIHTLKLNLMEARALAPSGVGPAAEAPALAGSLRDRGIDRVIITLGSEGVYHSSRELEGFFPADTAEIVNATGAGDAFFAGLVLGDVLGESQEKALRYAAAAAGTSMISDEAVNPGISRRMLDDLIRT